MKIQLLLLIVILNFSSRINSQVIQDWSAVYNGPNNFNDVSNSLVIDNLGNVYVTGYSNVNFIPPNSDYCTVKYNSLGVQEWIAMYNGNANGQDYSNNITIDVLGSVYVTGQSESIAGGLDIVTIKYNPAGIQQWVAVFDGSLAVGEKGVKVIVDNSGNIFVGGYVFRGPVTTMSDDIVILKYNSSGILQWSTYYNNPANQEDQLTCMAIDELGNIYAAGHSSQGSGINDDYVTIKLNSNGVQQWVKTYNGPGNDDDNISSLVVDKQGNVIVTGYSIGSDTYRDYATIKYTFSGAEQWISRYSFSANVSDNATGIVVDSLGNSYVTGTSSSAAATVKYNSLGIQQWAARYEGATSSGIVIDNLMNTYITGESFSFPNGQECTIIKYNSFGVQKWINKYKFNNNTGNSGRDIKIDNSGKVYVTGSTYATVPNNYDFLTLKYSQEPTNTNSVQNQIPNKFSLEQNYPNPFNPVTNIEFSLSEKSYVTLKIFDVRGKQMQELVNQNFAAGKYRYDFNAESLPSGTYFYKLETEKYSEVKKMILLK